MRFDKKVLIRIEKVNKNYRLPLKRLYERRIVENHEYRKISMGKGMRIVSTNSQELRDEINKG